MLRLLVSMCCLLVLVTIARAAERSRDPAKFEPPDGVTYHGVCISGIWSEDETKKNIASYRNNVTPTPLVLHSWFAHAQEKGKWRTWHWMNETPDGKGCIGPVSTMIETSRKNGLVPVIAWAWDDFHSEETSPLLQDLVAGKQDWLIDDWIAGVKEFKDPIFIRLSHEMDGDWYPYSEGYKKNPTRNTAKDYLAYWRYVVDRFRKAGVTNVAWVWCVNGDRSGGKDWPDYYPGDGYVDWIGIDPYSSRNPREMLGALVKMYANKPIMIPEGGTGDGQTKWNTHFVSNAAWTKELFDVIDATPQIKAFCWFEYEGYLIEHDADQLAEYQKRLAAPRFRHSWSPEFEKQ